MHTWGENFNECIPASLLMVAQKVGGVTAGAFDEQGSLLGFVFGLPGMKDGHPFHWSHMLGVRKEARGLGIGRRLKLHQRELLLEDGIDLVMWTYDPLAARNAHLNINRLGAEIVEYVPDMYGDLGSELHRGIGMDRFIVEWHIADREVERIISGRIKPEADRFMQAPVVNPPLSEDDSVPRLEEEPPLSPMVRVEIPPDILDVQTESLETAAQWRAATRRAFVRYLERGYRVKAFYRDPENGRCFYGLIMVNA
jgi:predicted GNAT superfamily acetyltransferase